MIKYISFCLCAFVLVSCTQVNSNSEKNITQGGDTVSEVDISLSKMDIVEELSKIDEPQTEKLIFKASGTEPGWYAQFYNNKVKLVYDYGKDSVTVANEFKNLDSVSGYQFQSKESKINITIQNKPCIASGSGDKEARTVIIVYNGKEYKGCGSFVK